MKSYIAIPDNKVQTVSNSLSELSVASNSAIQLQDNRPKSVMQKKQVKALANGREPLVQKKENKTGLPDQLKTGVENLSGHSMDDVKVHYNSDKPAQLNAHAYAQGTEIHIASGQEKHLPHEAWHVVQQKQGRVAPTMQMKDKVNVNDDKELEKEADVMGRRSLQRKKSSDELANSQINGKVITTQLKNDNPIQLGGGGVKNNNNSRQSQKTQTKFQRSQQRQQNTPAPKKSARGKAREAERTSRSNAKKYGNTTTKLEWYHYAMMGLMLASMIPVASAGATGPVSNNTGRTGVGHNDFTDLSPAIIPGNSTVHSPAVSGFIPPVVNNSSSLAMHNSMQTALVHDPFRSQAFTPITTVLPPIEPKRPVVTPANSTVHSPDVSGFTAPVVNNSSSLAMNNSMQSALVYDPVRSQALAHNATILPPVVTKPPFAQMPVPSRPHLKEVKLGATKPIDEKEVGASRGYVAESADFGYGKKWGQTFLKGAGTNYNTDNSTVRASVYNSRFLRSMGVTIPEIEPIRNPESGDIQIASKSVGDYKHYNKITKEGTVKPNFTAKQRTDYAKLALLSPVADLHKKNFGLINGGNMGTIDVDTALPMHSHNYRRLIDRFKLDPEGYKSNDMSGSFLGEGKIQDNVYYDKIEMKEADIVNAVKDFCSIPVDELADQLHDYPLQGKASQKLTLHSLITQQQMLREAFKDFKYEPSQEALWVNSPGYKLLETTIEKYEQENRFPYSFKVHKDKLKITVNEKFQRKKGTGFWDDGRQAVTNPQLLKAVESGHLGDANLRLTDKTSILPDDIPKMISAARPYLRSIGAGNQGVGFVVRLIHHPSFDKMSAASKNKVKQLFTDSDIAKDSSPFRQALFPKGESKGDFKVDSFHKGASQKLRDAVEKIRKL
jgi:hypothetical protein